MSKGGDCKSAPIPVPGFGFLCSDVVEILDQSYLEHLHTNFEDSDNYLLTVDQIDSLKCQAVMMPHWKTIYPDLGVREEKEVCAPKWDDAACLPPTLAGETAVFPCMSMYRGDTFSSDYNASIDCLSNGSWAPRTNYNDCLCHSSNPEKYLDYCEYQEEENTIVDISIIIHFVGYSISLLALLVAIAIFFSFRKCLRHKIHISIFCAFSLSALNWIITKTLPELTQYMESWFISVLCTCWVLTFFFHLTCFYWMFLEGFYLFLQVQFPLSLVAIKHKHFLAFGWGGSAFNILIWILVRIYHPAVEETTNCPFLDEDEKWDFYILHLPIYFILASNTFFLVWIMVIVVSKLKQRTALDHDRRHWKAAKALLVVMPVLGCAYLITLMGPSRDRSPRAYMVFQICRSLILSTQGLVISLPYCFLNSEVQTRLKKRWERWRMVRSVGGYTRTVRISATSSRSFTANTV